MESSPPIFHTLSFFLSFQVPWPSFIVALIVLFIARGAQHAQRDNWNVTKDNLGDYSYPKVSKGRDGERERRGKRGEGWAVGSSKKKRCYCGLLLFPPLFRPYFPRRCGNGATRLQLLMYYTTAAADHFHRRGIVGEGEKRAVTSLNLLTLPFFLSFCFCRRRRSTCPRGCLSCGQLRLASFSSSLSCCS